MTPLKGEFQEGRKVSPVIKEERISIIYLNKFHKLQIIEQLILNLTSQHFHVLHRISSIKLILLELAHMTNGRSKICPPSKAGSKKVTRGRETMFC